MTNTKTLLGALGAAALSLSVATTPALAEDDWAYTLTITGASDYMFRGISFSEEQPAFQPYLEFTRGLFYVGFWASNIDNSALGGFLRSAELDVYVGVRPVTGPINWDIAVLYYLYQTSSAAPAGVSWSDADYFEFKVGATTSPVENLTVGLTGFYTPDQDITSTIETWTIEGSAYYTLPAWGIFTPTIGGLVGYTAAEDGSGWFALEDEYVYWNAGLKLTVEKFFMDFRYWDTDIDSVLESQADARFVFSAGVALP